ncbi:tyrosine-protein kinase Etk/Wzc [Variovorax boronicumulans]|uniref:Tyrosine-protein kinase Etk/Wzc n=1 Tax=Variovorax boronicumulans TaxID=436515 RepID=A0AAW8CW32_9BURK|nr:polysaccharide biosynthesis tyrosine autokinase [Variovorax boronicumulans]MDP9891200.1 tyrosine-protein kinase Etk/Wzc [Variovorax boronicumulans]MDQ0051267.1 tyrosine-protein kinase Etk/Wzc [Variovorax boronicumulans]
MNARWYPPLPAPQGAEPDRPRSGPREYIDILLDHRWLIAAITAAALLVGACYALFGPRVYEANVLIQVEDADRSSTPADAAVNGVSVKTPTSGEAEILKSRMVLGQAIENTRLFIEARPHYLPLVGDFIARHSTELSNPGFLGLGDWVTGTERIAVAQMDVPPAFEGKRFLLTAGENGSYTLTHPDLATPLQGSVGVPLEASVPGGAIRLLVGSFEARPGGAFELTRRSRQLVLLELQNDLRVIEKGKQSGVMDVSWQTGNRTQLTELLNEVSRLYVRQNIDQKTVQAERTLDFLGTELPKFRQQLEQSEDVYNQYRNQNGTISLDDEARNALTQNLDLQSKLFDARLKRLDLMSRFTAQHPVVMTLDAQIASLRKELGAVDSRIRRMPMLQQNSVRMQRDIKVNTDLYASLLNSSLQMRLAREGKIGNVRVLDPALLPEKPVRPKAAIVMALALVAGLFLGAATAILRKTLKRTVASPEEIEAHTGLDVYSTIALSLQQARLDRAIRQGKPGVKVLAALHPEDAALEGVRRLRTTLRFTMLGAPNNRILLTSATPGAGKTFVSANLAAMLAASGKRVLLIDADVRRGSLAAQFGLAHDKGLAELIAGSATLPEATHAQVLPHLDVITSGTLPQDPATALAGDAFTQLLATLSGHYDIVLIDAPPILWATETVAMASAMGTLLLLARAGESQLGDLLESAKRLAHVGASFHGVVLNGLDARQQRYGSYGYGYGVYRFPPQAYPALGHTRQPEPEHAAS